MEELINILADRGVQAIPKKRGEYTIDAPLRNAAFVIREMQKFLQDEAELGNFGAHLTLQKCNEIASQDM